MEIEVSAQPQRIRFETFVTYLLQVRQLILLNKRWLVYTYVRALALSRSIGSQWREVLLADILVFDIFQTYTKVYLVLANSVLTEDVYVDMDTLRTQYSSYNGTLEDLLILNGNNTLDTVAALPDTTVKFARYSDAIRAGYKIKPCIAGQIVPEGYPSIDLLDLKVTREPYTTDMQLIEDYCLVSVNGYYHWDETANGESFIFNGAVTMRKSNLNHMGIYSFHDVGKLTKIKLDPEEIKPVTDGTFLRDKINFSVTEDLDDKSYILVLGGYLCLPQEGVFWRSGEHGFTLDINRISYKERIFESQQYIDLKSLGLTTFPIGDDVVSVDQLFSDDVIKKYMTMSQSFLVIVDTPNLTSNKIHVRHSSLPGMFTTYQDPTYPLIVNYGKVAEYWKTEEAGQWSLSVQDSFLRNYIASQQPVRNGQAVTDNLLGSNPFYHSRGFLLELSSYGSV